VIGSTAGFCSQKRDETLLYSTASRQPLRSTQSPIQWVMKAISMGVKRPECEADHIPPSSATVKNGGAIPTTPVSLNYLRQGLSVVHHKNICG
jgi:hypothetical protein